MLPFVQSAQNMTTEKFRGGHKAYPVTITHPSSDHTQAGLALLLLIIPHRAVQLDEDSADGNYNKGTGNRCIMTTQYTASILEGKVWV